MVERRKTVLPDGTPLALTETFSSDPGKQTQWRAFLRRIQSHTSNVFTGARWPAAR